DWCDLLLLLRRAGCFARRAGPGKILRRDGAAARRAGEVVGEHGHEADCEHEGVDDAHRRPPHSRERPKRGRSRMPIAQPPAAAANQIYPCSEPDATPPTKAPMLQPKPRRAPMPISRLPISAAASDGHAGQLARANGLLPVAAAIAPRIMSRSVRLDVSE